MRTLIYNADIRTMHPAMPRAEAAIVENDRFGYVGTLQEARRLLAGKPHDAIDAGGATVLPGFNDAHLHFLHYAKRTQNVALEEARSVQDCIQRLREGLERRPGGGWLIGEGWNQEHYADRRMLTRADLDEVSTDVPIFAVRACGHIAAANSQALTIAGIDVPDGQLREDEQSAVWACIPVPDDGALIASMRAAQTDLFRQGITSIQSDDLGGVPEGREASFLRALAGACEDGILKMRYAQQALAGGVDGFRAFFDAGLHTLRGERFRVSHMKVLADGSLGARTAAMRLPYADAPDTCGIALYTNEALAGVVREAAAHGMPTAIHAIGDAAMQQALDVFAREGKGLRNAIVHAQIADAAQVECCGALGLLLLVQPIFLDADAPIVRARVGVLADTSYRWRSALGLGARVAFSTDCPVEPFDPFANLFCAVTRRGLRGGEPYLPDEAFTLDEALYAYTAAGAYASGEEGEKGRVWPGMLADYLVLKDRLDGKAPASLLEAGVRACYVGGERVYGG